MAALVPSSRSQAPSVLCLPCWLSEPFALSHHHKPPGSACDSQRGRHPFQELRSFPSWRSKHAAGAQHMLLSSWSHYSLWGNLQAVFQEWKVSHFLSSGETVMEKGCCEGNLSACEKEARRHSQPQKQNESLILISEGELDECSCTENVLIPVRIKYPTMGTSTQSPTSRNHSGDTRRWNAVTRKCDSFQGQVITEGGCLVLVYVCTHVNARMWVCVFRWMCACPCMSVPKWFYQEGLPKEADCIICCCVMNYSKFSDLKQHTFVISRFLWVKIPGFLGYPTSPLKRLQWRLRSHLKAWLAEEDPLPNFLVVTVRIQFLWAPASNKPSEIEQDGVSNMDPAELGNLTSNRHPITFTIFYLLEVSW